MRAGWARCSSSLGAFCHSQNNDHQRVTANRRKVAAATRADAKCTFSALEATLLTSPASHIHSRCCSESLRRAGLDPPRPAPSPAPSFHPARLSTSSVAQASPAQMLTLIPWFTWPALCASWSLTPALFHFHEPASPGHYVG